MNVKFNIECEMNERWVPAFLKMLETMEHLGRIGSSRIVGIYSDGDGDFRPRFKHSVTNYDGEVYPYPENYVKNSNFIYDADYEADKAQFEKDCKSEKEKRRSENG